jgi:hypothetical protein
MDSFPGDYYGQRCRSGKKSSDIFNDYLNLLDGVLAHDESEINWQLTNNATAEEFESWERHMLEGFYRCATYDHNMDDSTCLALADRRVDIKLHNWWKKRCGRRALPLQLGQISGNFCESALYLLVLWFLLQSPW